MLRDSQEETQHEQNSSEAKRRKKSVYVANKTTVLSDFWGELFESGSSLMFSVSPLISLLAPIRRALSSPLSAITLSVKIQPAHQISIKTTIATNY